MSTLTRLAVAVALIVASTAVPFTQTPAASDVDRLAWLAGCWQQPRPDGLTEEHWMKPSGGTMIGMSRTVRGGKTTEHEFLQMRDVDGRLAYVAAPSGQAGATFPLKSIADNEVVFENLKHDFPHRIIYRRAANGGVTARIEGEIGGKVKAIDFPYTRCQ